ncbi:MAG: TonB-dependent receptor [Flavobacteriales bacterium]|nr:TonB-dependent receptor [Flavobacteriales bacterium]MCB9449777.1 TonB-dependent receptor [Flavobacteriales bacterium]
MNKWSLSLVVGLLTCHQLFAQDHTQTIRGRVTDMDTRSPLPGAAILLLDSDPVRGTTADSAGYFHLDQVPVGRVGIQVSYIGYKTATLQNMVLTSGKQMVLDVKLEEWVIQGEEVVIEAERNKQIALNEMATVSARQFSVEETNRYAGTLGDPARMASNFAGVGSASDQRNDIIIRGNSPIGVLWRFEGLDIPSPNHFVSQGTNGGPISILNNNLLSNSDFFTGAFPAEYGNALAGVFDLTMRSGNSEKREYTFQVGFNGAELMAEGPFSRRSEHKASYLASYRYSTLDIFEALGIKFGVAGIPRYQDLSFKTTFPLARAGELEVFGIGGISRIDLKNSERKPDENSLGLRNNRDAVFGTQMGTVGVVHTYHFNEQTFQRIIIATSGNNRLAEVDSVSETDHSHTQVYSDHSSQTRWSMHYTLNKKFNARHQLKTGFIANRPDFNYDENTLDHGVQRSLRTFSGYTYVGQLYAQWRYRITDVLSLTGGVHSQHFTYNNTHTLEPRIGMRWQFHEKQTLNLGYGLHSQLPLYEVYFYETPLANGKRIRTNRNLGFMKSHQVVAGYDFAINRKLRLKTEAYYQYLFDIPVKASGRGSFSAINLGSDFVGLPPLDSLSSTGTGNNYGVEITLERFFGNGFYYLGTLSLFASDYTAGDGITRSSAYDGRYVFHVLGGKEFRIGKNNQLSIDGRITRAGGKPYTPLDLAASYQAGAAVFDDTQAFTKRFPDYFRADMNLRFRLNGKKVTQEWAFDIQNILNTQNILLLNYDPVNHQEAFEYQLGFFPVFQYRLIF